MRARGAGVVRPSIASCRAARPLLLVLSLLATLLASPGESAAQAPAPAPAPAKGLKLIVILSTHEPAIPAVATLIKGIREGLGDSRLDAPQILVEHLDRSAPTGADEDTQRTLLAQKYRGRAPDLVIALGTAAVEFAVRLRTRMWSRAPIVFADAARILARSTTAANLTGVVAALETDRTLHTAVQLFPGTRRIAIINGSSAIEQALQAEFLKDVREYDEQLELIDLAGLPLEQVRQRVASMPDDAVAYFITFRSDATERSFIPADALRILSAASRRPIFGASDHYLGHGIFGGWLIDYGQLGREVSAQALRILAGEPAAAIPIERSASIRPMFDARQLKRFGVKEDRLPAGSIVLFAQPTLWQQYRGFILAALTALVLQAALIGLLLFERERRRGAEARALRLSGELIQATETERSRIARELHDDISQRLALLSIEIDQAAAGAKVKDTGAAGHIRALSAKTRGIADDIHQLAKELHPATLKLLGLPAAARAFCAELERRHGIAVKVYERADLKQLPEAAGLTLYRVMQEALQNAIKHSGARDAWVTFARAGEASGNGAVASVTVADNGSGFDPDGAAGGTGLAGMRERLRLVGGTLEVESAPDEGTTIIARVPQHEVCQ